MPLDLATTYDPVISRRTVDYGSSKFTCWPTSYCATTASEMNCTGAELGSIIHTVIAAQLKTKHKIISLLCNDYAFMR